MAEEEGSATEAVALRQKFQDIISELKRSSESTLDASNSFCRDFCQVRLYSCVLIYQSLFVDDAACLHRCTNDNKTNNTNTVIHKYDGKNTKSCMLKR